MSVNPSHGNSGSSNGVLHQAVQQASNDSNRTSDQGPTPASTTPESADVLSATLNGTGSAPSPPAISGPDSTQGTQHSLGANDSPPSVPDVPSFAWAPHIYQVIEGLRAASRRTNSSNSGSNPTSNGQSSGRPGLPNSGRSQQRSTLNGNGVNGTRDRPIVNGWFGASSTEESARERAERANRRFRGGARVITQQHWTRQVQSSEEAREESSAPQQAQPGGDEDPGVSSLGTNGTDATYAPVNGSNGHENGINDHADGSEV
jgi:hypothetical protein